jgi:aspartyl/glutamyl-tRNA(Asn/Gln) amidotransferase C subunit
MSITQEQIQKIAEKLSKIPGNNGKIAKNIQDTLGYMDLLSEIDTSWVIPTVSVIENNMLLREDKLSVSLSTPAELLSCSEQKIVWQHIVLPNIMH